MFEKLSDTLNLLMAEVHISAEELARRTGVPASTIKKIRNRYNPNPTLTTLLPLATYFSVTLDQLVGIAPLSASRIKGLYQSAVAKYLPVISWVEALEWPDIQNSTDVKITSEFHYSANAYALLVEADNWENLARGTALLIDPELKAEHRDFVIVHKAGQPVPALKQILYDEEQIYLKPLIQGYNMTVLSNAHRILGVVVEYQKHLKKNFFQ